MSFMALILNSRRCCNVLMNNKSIGYKNVTQILNKQLRLWSLLKHFLPDEKALQRPFIEMNQQGDEVKIFKGVSDRYHGITVVSNDEPCTAFDFPAVLIESLSRWKIRKVRGVWFKVFLNHADWVPILAENGFTFHHAKPEYVMMCKWLPSSEDECNIPHYAHTMIGVGAVVVNSKDEILAVREKYYENPHWKLPGGYVEPDKKRKGAEKLCEKKKKLFLLEAEKCSKLTDIFKFNATSSSELDNQKAVNGIQDPVTENSKTDHHSANSLQVETEENSCKENDMGNGATTDSIVKQGLRYFLEIIVIFLLDQKKVTGEDIVDAVIREVIEETSVNTKFHSIVAFRHTHGIQFSCSDLYFIVSLIPMNEEIVKCDREIVACQWMKIEDFLNHPHVHETNRQFVSTFLNYRSNGIQITFEKNKHPVINRPQSIFSASLTSNDISVNIPQDTCLSKTHTAASLS